MALISVTGLQDLIRDTIAAAPFSLPAETVAPEHAAGRILAEAAVSPLNLPPENVSAMDGFALPAAAGSGSTFRIAGESAAGRPFDGILQPGECIRIMTGAVVPPGAAAVVMKEDTQENAGVLSLCCDVAAGSHIRCKGEEIAVGDTVLPAGRILRRADAMTAAACGFGRLPVYRRLRVAVFSGGDELVEPGLPLTAPGQIYDSCRAMLKAKLHGMPFCEIIDAGCLPDSAPEICARLAAAAETADAVITTGGVSAGDYDFLRQAVEETGVIHHYKVAMKPGKPFVFGRLKAAWYFGLPGNPVSGFVGFDFFIRRALLQAAGARNIPEPLRVHAVLSETAKKTPGRTDIQRAILSRAADGSLTVKPAGLQDSHRVLGVGAANAYMILPAESGDIAAGSMVEVQPLSDAFL